MRAHGMGGARLERPGDPVLSEARRGTDGGVDGLPTDEGRDREAGGLRQIGRGSHRTYTTYRTYRGAWAKARTGKVPMPFTFTGTAKKRAPRSGTASSPHMCSTMGMPAPSKAE